MTEYFTAPWLEAQDTTAVLLAQSITTETSVGTQGTEDKADTTNRISHSVWRASWAKTSVYSKMITTATQHLNYAGFTYLKAQTVEIIKLVSIPSHHN